MKDKTYLGDGVYASYDGFHIILETNNGISKTNEIFLEDQVLDALLRYMEKCFVVKITAQKRKEEE